MNLNPPRRVRAVLYLIATFATPTVLWASTENHIGSALTVLFGSYIAICTGLATANTVGSDDPKPPRRARRRDQRGITTLGIVLLVVVVLVVVALLGGQL